MSLSAILSLGVRGTYAVASDLSSRGETFGDQTSWVKQLLSGTTAGKADQFFSDQRTLSASSSENLDLAGGLTDAFGAALTFVKVKAILVKAADANVNDVVIGGAASNAFVGPLGGTTPTVAVKPGGWAAFFAPGDGWTVTASTGDILKMANGGSGSSVTYDIVVIGTSA